MEISTARCMAYMHFITDNFAISRLDLYKKLAGEESCSNGKASVFDRQHAKLWRDTLFISNPYMLACTVLQEYQCRTMIVYANGSATDLTGPKIQPISVLAVCGALAADH